MEKLSFCLLVMVLGMAVTFLGLTILIVLINVASRIIGASGRNDVSGADLPAPVMETNVTAAEEVNALEGDSVTVAISAAVATYMGGDKKIAVKSIRRAAQ